MSTAEGAENPENSFRGLVPWQSLIGADLRQFRYFLNSRSPPILKGDLGGFSRSYTEIPPAPLYERGGKIVRLELMRQSRGTTGALSAFSRDGLVGLEDNSYLFPEIMAKSLVCPHEWGGTLAIEEVIVVS